MSFNETVQFDHIYYHNVTGICWIVGARPAFGLFLHKHAYFILSIRPPCTSEFSLYLDVLEGFALFGAFPKQVNSYVDQP